MAIKEKKAPVVKFTDAEKVDEYMRKLDHPLKAEIEAVRAIIKGANGKINERIKWNAPSYFYKQDMVTFNHRVTNHVHLVFHHPDIVSINSTLLQGDYKDRRMMYLRDMSEVKEHTNELKTIMNKLVNIIDNKPN